MKKLIFTVLLISICSFALPAQTRLTKEDYSVYAAILKNIRPDSLKDNTTQIYFVILDTTTVNAYIYDKGKVNKIRGLASNFKQINKFPAKLEDSFPIKQRYEITNISEIRKLLDMGGKEFDEAQQKRKAMGQPIFTDDAITYWKYFDKKYPYGRGYYQFSRVGFSTNKRFAVVSVEFTSIGSFYYTTYVLRKTKERWKVYGSGGYNSIE